MRKNLLKVAFVSALLAIACPVFAADGDGSTSTSPVTLENEPATATFVFELGTEGQKATFSNSDYFLSSKVTTGSEIFIKDIDNKGNGQTRIGTTVANASAPTEDNALRFLIQPRHGFMFTPTKVSFVSTRYGTDGGKIDAAWYNPDGTTVALDSGQTPQRDNATPNVSEYSYEITGATPAEGACGLQLNIYGLGDTKQLGFRDIVIEGTLSGTESQIPALASFTANGVEYIADDIFQADGSDFTTTIKLAKAETMVSESNPVTNVTPLSGELGDITYVGDDESMVVTMPLTLGDITINYVANFIRKPFYTLTYFDTDGTEMGTQLVEEDAKIENFEVDYTTAKAEEGTKVRGWFAVATHSRKWTVEDVITEDINLYALATEIEVESKSLKYTYDLSDEYFYHEDHEGINIISGSQDPYFHDTTHGWAFHDGAKVELLVGPKATIYVGLCRYGYGTTILFKDEDGNEFGTLPAISESQTDGEVVAIDYEGKGGLITLELQSTGEMYFHNFKVVNTSEVSYQKVGQWFYVTPNDVNSLLDVIEAACGTNSSVDSERTFIWIPDGLYDLKETVLTNISGHNISLIGQSMEGTVIKNAPHYSTEGISTTATLMNTGRNNYFQDLTIQNALDYYATIAGQQVGGRAVALWDKGLNTVCKNVTLLSYQDTYYTNNDNGQYYWEDSDIHGTVDFICGGGTLLMQNSTLTVEMRNSNGKGACTLTAPATAAGKNFGYVFKDCTIKNYAEGYNFGRAWSNEPRCAYINTTFSDDKLSSDRWTANGMNVAAKSFVEYHSMDTDGNVVSPESHIMTFIKGDNVNTMETILTDSEAAMYTVENIFPDWNPAELAAQVVAPAATLKDGAISWEPVSGAIAYAVFADDELVAITEDNTVSGANADACYTIRSANSMGGLGVAAHVEGSAESSVESVDAAIEVVETVYYNLTGLKVDNTSKGVLIKVETLSNGNVVTTKVVNK